MCLKHLFELEMLREIIRHTTLFSDMKHVAWKRLQIISEHDDKQI